MKLSKVQESRTIFFFLGILVFGIIIYLGGKEALNRVLYGDIVYLSLVLISTGVIIFIGSLRWGLIANSIEGRKVLSSFQFYYYQILSRVVGLMFSRNVGDLGAKSLWLKMSGSVSTGTAVYSSLLDKIFDLWLLFILIVPVILYTSDMIGINIYFSFVLILILIGMIAGQKKYEWVLNLSLQFLESIATLLSRFKLFERKINRDVLVMIERARNKFGRNSDFVAKAQYFTIIKFALIIIRAYWISLALGLQIPLSRLFIGMPIALAGTLVSVTPGGLGSQEFGWYGALAIVGVDASSILLFLIGQRVYTTLSILILAGLSHASYFLLNRVGDG